MSTEQGKALKSLEDLLADLVSQSSPGLEAKLREATDLLTEIRARQALQDKGILSKFRLDGQVALVTGGGQGIGEAIAHALGEAGCKVAVADIVPTRADKVSKDLESKGIPAVALTVDVSNKNEVDLMVHTVLTHWGRLDIGVNNAGIVIGSRENKSEDVPEDQWRRTMGINLDGVFFCCQAQARFMLQAGRGKIINMASICATVTTRPQLQAAYQASKAAVKQLTRSLAAEWAPRGVNVNCISPGYTDTPLTQVEGLKEVREHWIKDTPMGRLGQVEDLVGAALYLASPLSDFTTGLDLIVDRGFTLW